MRRCWAAGTALLAALALGVAPALAAGLEAAAGPAAEAWRILVRLDVEAAYRLLADNHPGALPQTGDPAFRARLERAHAQALQRIGAVTSLEGYAATLAEFAHSLEDGHINTATSVQLRTVSWAGVIAARRGERWVVAAADPKVAGRDLAGAEIMGCDGVAAEDLAAERLIFHTNTNIPALQAVQAGWLLVDDGNPFLARPQTCVFRQRDGEVRVTLNWTSIGYAALRRDWWKAPVGAAGFGLRAAGDGYWIGLQQLDPRAQAVIDAVAVQAAGVRGARFVVVDLRGNGGGNDAYGRALAEAIYGPDFVLDVLGPRGDDGACPSVFRASDGNAEALAREARRMEKSGDAVGARGYDTAVRQIADAKAHGRPLTGSLSCPQAGGATPAGAAHASLAKAPVLVLTDAACFSSCINTADMFRRLGAVHVGQPTGGDTHYSEVRAVTLPSGLSQFSTLQAVMPDAPLAIGPFAPQFTFDGDMADTAALEAWVQGPVLAAVRHGGEAVPARPTPLRGSVGRADGP